MSVASIEIISRSKVAIVMVGTQGPPGPAGLSAIGTPLSGGLAGSILFADAAGILAQAAGFAFDPVRGALKLVDRNYVPLAGALNADCLFSVGSNDNQQNNPGTVQTSNHFIGAAVDLKVDASGANKWIAGMFTQIRTGGNYTGTGYIYGHWIMVNNRLNTGGAVSYVYGVDASINLEGDAVESVGIQAASFRGNAISCPKFVGIRALAQNGYVNADVVTGGEFVAQTGSAGARVAIARAVHAKTVNRPGHTLAIARGISVDGWTNVGTVEKSVGLYIDETVDQGTLERFAILSESTSDSKLAGSLEIGSPVQASLDIRRQYVAFSDCENHSGFPQNGWTSGNNVAGVFNATAPNMALFPDSVGVFIWTLRLTAVTSGVLMERSFLPSTLAAFGALGNGIVKHRYKFQFLALSDAVNTYVVRAGVANGGSAIAPTRGSFFRYTDGVNGGRWQAVCLDSAGETAVDTGVAAAVDGSMHVYETVVAADAGEVAFYIDDVLVATIATNIPTGETLGGMLHFMRSAGTTNLDIMAVDYVRSEWNFATPRK